MPLIPRAITRPVARLGAAAQNALEVARFGGLDTGEEASPYEVVGHHRVYRLRRYFPATDPTGRPPVILVPPMMLAAEVYDVSPASSAVALLHRFGVDPWVVDFGAPEKEEGGLERTLTDHVLAVSDAVDRVREATGRDVHLGGYSQGGMFCYQTAAYRRGDGLDSLITFGSPVDTHGAMPFQLPEGVVNRGAGFLADRVLGRSALPAWASRTGFRMMDPVKSLRQRVDFIMQLHDREALLPRERQRRFLMGEGWVAWPGPAMAELFKQFVAHNRMLRGGFVIEDRLVTLADISCPVLTFVGEVDEIAPAPAVRAISRAAPRADVYEVALRAGHFGLVVGSAASVTTWPVVAGWTLWRAGQGPLPEPVLRVEEAAQEDAHGHAGARAGYGLRLAVGVGTGVARSVAVTASRTTGTIRGLATDTPATLRRLGRLGQVRPETRVSLGLLLDEQAAKDPDHVFVLLEGRAHTRAAVKARIDAVVRGLISVGVRQGDHVGVLMAMRPSALTVVSAINRLGAVAVLVRPDGDAAQEVSLGAVGRVVADPEHAPLLAGLDGVQVLVLGGGGERRELEIPGAVDMEAIDPDAVDLPAWYRPNPGRARDLAFVLFTGEGDRTRVNRVTNRRWALSAFGTASAAALSSADTVYSATPIHHPSSLLMTLGGAVAGGTRLAITRTFDPDTFWDEARRYGATVASYTWTMLRDLVEAPPLPGERHHSVRLFIGSGMPRGIWRRVTERFSPARVLEFYAPTQGDLVLVNVSGAKPGSLGRPLPGSARVVIARYDPVAGRLQTGPDGLGRECVRGEVGMLLAEVRPDAIPYADPLRSVFEPDDAWLPTGDLFIRDEDGDHWLVDRVPSLIRAAGRMIPTIPIRDALGDLDAVDIAVAYGIPKGDDATEIAVAAVTLRAGRKLDATDITDALAGLDPLDRPQIVHIVDEIPRSTWYRPRTGPLRAAGIPPAGNKAWYLDTTRDVYRPLTQAARRKLM